MARRQYKFNSGILASGKTRMALKTSKTATERWLASKSKNMPVAMKRQTNNQLFASSLPGKRAKVVILMQPHLLSRCGPKRDKRQTQLGRTLVNRWQYNFNSGILASGKTRMAPKKSKFPAA